MPQNPRADIDWHDLQCNHLDFLSLAKSLYTPGLLEPLGMYRDSPSLARPHFTLPWGAMLNLAQPNLRDASTLSPGHKGVPEGAGTLFAARKTVP